MRETRCKVFGLANSIEDLRGYAQAIASLLATHSWPSSGADAIQKISLFVLNGVAFLHRQVRHRQHVGKQVVLHSLSFVDRHRLNIDLATQDLLARPDDSRAEVRKIDTPINAIGDDLHGSLRIEAGP